DHRHGGRGRECRVARHRPSRAPLSHNAGLFDRVPNWVGLKRVEPVLYDSAHPSSPAPGLLWLPMAEASMDKFDQITSFVRVVELGGFAAAAGDLAVAPSLVTAHIKALEQRLGARL